MTSRWPAVKGILDPEELRRVSAASLEVVNERKRENQGRAEERAKRQLYRTMDRISELLHSAALRGLSDCVVPVNGSTLRKMVMDYLRQRGFVVEEYIGWDIYGVSVSWQEDQP